MADPFVVDTHQVSFRDVPFNQIFINVRFMFYKTTVKASTISMPLYTHIHTFFFSPSFGFTRLSTGLLMRH